MMEVNIFLCRISRSLGAANDLDLLQKVLDFAMSVSKYILKISKVLEHQCYKYFRMRSVAKTKCS